MLRGRVTRAVLGLLDIFPTKSRTQDGAAHLRTGQRGEEDAYFYLRRKGYVIVARNYRTARHRGEIDLIAWDKDVLCFVEVKTRTTHDIKPAEAAVDRKKRHDLRTVIRDYMRTLPRRHFPEPPQWRFDVVTVYYENDISRTPASGLGGPRDNRPESRNRRLPHPTFELFQNASLSS